MRRLLAALACLALAGCAARLPARPGGPATPDPTAVSAFIQATAHCAGLRTVTAALRLSGRAGGERLRGTLHTGFASPASLRVEAVAPFGRPLFILAGRDNRATLLLPRDERVLHDAPVPDVLERLTGLSLSSADLRLILTGCLADAPQPADGRAFSDDWRAVTLDDGIVAYLRPVAGAPAVVAADHGDWRVDYANHLNGFPRQVRIRSTSGHVDITAALEELEVNTPLVDEAFEVMVPPDVAPITIDQLRSVAPLREPPR